MDDKKTKGQQQKSRGRREQPRPKVPLLSGGKKKREPRGPLFRSGDSTLAKRLEEEVYRSGR